MRSTRRQPLEIFCRAPARPACWADPVGGAAAVLHGAPITTQDIDVVHRTDAANVERFRGARRDLDARVRNRASRDIQPHPDLLGGDGQIKMTTSAGPSIGCVACTAIEFPR